MWRYMKEQAGNHRHPFLAMHVYVHVDLKELEPKYKLGVVWWKEERVAEWDWRSGI